MGCRNKIISILSAYRNIDTGRLSTLSLFRPTLNSCIFRRIPATDSDLIRPLSKQPSEWAAGMGRNATYVDLGDALDNLRKRYPTPRGIKSKGEGLGKRKVIVSAPGYLQIAVDEDDAGKRLFLG